jgi:VanZ family protein
MYLSEVPWLWPGVLVSFLAAVAVSAHLGRVLGTRRTLAGALVLGVGIVLAATLTPSAEALASGARGEMTCDLTRMGRAPLAELLAIDDTSLNVLLFVPLGVVVGLLPRSRAKVTVVVATLALPLAVEVLQLLATGLDRTCQSADVIDNLTGLLLGLGLGSVLGWLARRWGGTHVPT